MSENAQEALAAAVRDFERDFDAFHAVLEDVPAALQSQSGACGEWSPQDVASHLSGWVIEAKRRYRRFPRGTGNVVYNIDVFNSLSVRARRRKSWDAVTQELRRVTRELVQFTAEISPENIARDTRYIEWLEALARDARQHTHQLRAFLQEN